MSYHLPSYPKGFLIQLTTKLHLSFPLVSQAIGANRSAGWLSYVSWNLICGTLHDISTPVAGNYPKFCVDDLLHLNKTKYQRKLRKCASELRITELVHHLSSLDRCIAVKFGLVDTWTGKIFQSKLERLRMKSSFYGGENSKKFSEVAKKCTFWHYCINKYCKD